MADASDPLATLAMLEGVPSAMAAARDGIDALLGDRGLRRTTPSATTESLLVGAHASAVLAGSACSLEQLRAGDTDEPAHAAARLSSELLSLVPVVERSPLQALARLHTLAAAGTVPHDDLGRPQGAESADRLSGLASLLTDATQAPALVVAAVVHADLATAEAFCSHNRIVARAAERLLLVSRGVDPVSGVAVEAGHLRLRREYESNLRGYASGNPAGVHQWLLYAAEGYAAATEESRRLYP